MTIGLLRVVLRLDEANSLKDKRRVVKSLLDRVSGKFNAACAETGSLDLWNEAELAFVTVSNDRRHANSMLDTIRGYVEANAQAEVTEAEIELI